MLNPTRSSRSIRSCTTLCASYDLRHLADLDVPRVFDDCCLISRETLSMLAGTDMSSLSLSELSTRMIDAVVEVIQDDEVRDVHVPAQVTTELMSFCYWC